MTDDTHLSWRIAGLVALALTVSIVMTTSLFPPVAGINRVLPVNLSVGRPER